jgi:hypothetical protein
MCESCNNETVKPWEMDTKSHGKTHSNRYQLTSWGLAVSHLLRDANKISSSSRNNNNKNNKNQRVKGEVY